MTTVTEAAKRLVGGADAEALKEGDLERILSDQALAHRLARRLTEAVREIAPGREWTVEDLRDVLEVAVRGVASDRPKVLEGRYFRKRLREHGAIAERYGDPFACVVLKLGPERPSEMYSSVLDAVTENLRRTDMVFLYRKRLALVLPRMRADALGPFLDRVRNLVAVGAGEQAIESLAALVYPHEEVPDTAAVLDWAEDQLRDGV